MMTNNTFADKPPAQTAPALKLLDQVRERLRLKHYSIRTEQAYLGWIKRFIFFHDKRHPREMGKAELETFVTALAVARVGAKQSTTSLADVSGELSRSSQLTFT